MKLSSRRKPLTLIFCCSFAGTLAAILAGEARGQNFVPFRVDPGLLGLPPVKPVGPVGPAIQAPVERPSAEPRPVEQPAVEMRPLPTLPIDTPSVEADSELTQPSEEGMIAPGAPPAERTEPVDSPPEQPAEPAAKPPAPPPVAQETPAEMRSTQGETRLPSAPPTPVERAPGKASEDLPPVTAAPLPGAAAPVTHPAAEPDLRLRMAGAMVPPPPESDEPRPVFLSAQRISGVVGREVVAEDDAELRKVGTVLTADRLTYWPVDDEVEAAGNVRLQQGDDVISGPRVRLKIDDQVGFIEQASYFVKRQSGVVTPADDQPATGFAAPRPLGMQPRQPAVKTAQKAAGEITEGRGDAARIDLEGENQLRMSSATYTTCKPGNDDWYLSVAELKLDYDHDVGSGKDATVRFFGAPILYSPWISFPLNNERKSGFLAPSYGSSSTSGTEFALPYYWNIAPNMDATIEPRLLTKRGLQLGSEFRYLDAALGGSYNGQADLEYLPNDRKTDTDRWGVALRHSQTTPSGFAGVLNYSRVSDNDYYTDLSSQISSTAKTQLLQQGLLSYGGGGWWTATANVQSFQTLQPDPENPVSKPYRLLPQITLNARQPDLYAIDSSVFGQYTAFVHPDNDMVEGQRTVLQPQVSLPYVTPGWYVTPRVAANLTYYSLSYPTAGDHGPSSISRTLPIFSVDSGMTFERPSNWFGRDYTQTLEPRLFYLNIPYEKQNDIPVFDTALADFNFAQIFADNQFSGWDRINNANQLTAALGSRLIDPASGGEVMRAMIGQRLYFTDDKVALPGSSNRKWDKSDFLAGFSGQVWPRVYADAALQYDPGGQQFERYSLGARYLPELGKVVNAIYSYNPDAGIPIKQIDLSGQWPISGRWQAVGRYNYSFLQDQPIEIIGGLEYNAGCWAVRTVAHRVQTTEADATTQFFVQLELNGLASVGSNPLRLLQRRIPGYAAGPVAVEPGLAEW
jgi:LPS-assembly protein